MPVTLHDLATKLGVSIATVSRALSGAEGVSAATRARVLATAQELSYRPNITARRLQKQRTETLAFIIPTFGPRFSDPYFSELLTGIGNEAAKHEYDLLVSTRGPGSEEMASYERLVTERRVDGCLVVRTRRDDSRITYLTEQNFPFVAFGRSDLDIDFPYLDVDGQAGVQMLTQYLLELGHRRIAYVSAPLNLMFASYRLAGYRAALTRAGLPYDESLVVTGGLTDMDGYKAGREFLQRANPPTAIIAGNDLMALGVLSAAQELGLRVGRDVSIAGFDDISLAELAHPSLTTLRQPIYQIGQRICDMLLCLLNGVELEISQVLLKPELIVRQSTGRVG